MRINSYRPSHAPIQAELDARQSRIAPTERVHGVADGGRVETDRLDLVNSARAVVEQTPEAQFQPWTIGWLVVGVVAVLGIVALLIVSRVDPEWICPTVAIAFFAAIALGGLAEAIKQSKKT